MSTDFQAPVRDLKRLYRLTYWTIASTGPAALFLAGLFLAGEAPSSSVILWATVAALVVSIGCGSAALWLFVEHRGRRQSRGLLWTGWAFTAAGVGIGLVEPPVAAAWIVPAAILESGRILWNRPERYWRRTLASCAAVVTSVLILFVLDLASGYAMFLAVVLVMSLEGAVVGQWWFYQVADRLDEAREMTGQLAVAEERLRFAAELHDIQGGHLQAIILKAQLARRLVPADPERAGTELEAVEELARLALKDTRAVVSGYRKVSLSEEIDSAARILRSAGIQAAVRTDAADFDERTEHLLGLLVREATTNILRHSEAKAAEMAVAADGASVAVTVANDGVAGSDGPRGNGITMLAERFEEAGGTVERERRDGRFTLTGTLPFRHEEDV